jgi:hypothetical protein
MIIFVNSIRNTDKSIWQEYLLPDQPMGSDNCWQKLLIERGHTVVGSVLSKFQSIGKKFLHFFHKK